MTDRPPPMIQASYARRNGGRTQSSKRALAAALVLVAVSLVALLAIALYATNETLDEIESVEQEHVEAQKRSEVAATERQQIVTDLECYAKNSTEFYLIVSDLLIFNLTLDLNGPDVTEEQRQAALDALDRLENFKLQAQTESLTCSP